MGMRMKALYVAPETHAALKVKAAQKGITVQTAVEEAVRLWFELTKKDANRKKAA